MATDHTPLLAATATAPAVRTVPYRALFRYATPWETVGLYLGVACSLVNGAALPLFSLLFGQLLDDLNSPADIVDRVTKVAIDFLLLGAGAFVASLGEIGLLNVLATNQIERVRQRYFSALLRQDVAWYDENMAGDVASRLAENTIQMYGGMGQKLGNTIHAIGTLVGGIFIGFYHSWKLSLVIIAFFPGFAIFGGLVKVCHTSSSSYVFLSQPNQPSPGNSAVGYVRW